jgi:hypothetical protein
MADLIIVTPAPIVLSGFGTVGSAVALDLRLAIDVMRWDVVDLSIGFLSASANVTLDLLSAMTADTEDKAWDVFTASPASLVGSATTGGSLSAPLYKSVSLPASNALLRFLRWRIYAASGTASASFVITGLGRRKGS